MSKSADDPDTSLPLECQRRVVEWEPNQIYMNLRPDHELVAPPRLVRLDPLRVTCDACYTKLPKDDPHVAIA